MSKAADNDYCPNCGSIDCSADCYHGLTTTETETAPQPTDPPSPQKTSRRISPLTLFLALLAAILILIMAHP